MKLSCSPSFPISAHRVRRMVCDCGCKGRHTFDVVLRVLAWVLIALITRMYPSKRDDGTEWEDSPHKEDRQRAHRARSKEKFLFGGTFLQKRGDWAWMKQIFGLRGWKDKAGCCWKCLANVTTHPMTDASLHASWRGTMLTTLMFLTLAAANGDYISPIFDWPGWLLEFFQPDFMHCVCLGITQQVLGNILYELFRSLGGTKDNWGDAVGHLYFCIRLASKAIGRQVPLSGLTFLMIKQDGKSPKLRAKAAEGRYMVPVVKKMLEMFFPSSADHDKLRYECLSALNNVYLQLASWSDDSSPHIVASEGRRHIMLYAELAKEWLATHKTRSWIGWKFIPKHHLATHCFEDQISEFGNPAQSWCYRDENEIGVAVRLCEAEMHPRGIRKQLLMHYRSGFATV